MCPFLLAVPSHGEARALGSSSASTARMLSRCPPSRPHPTPVASQRPHSRQHHIGVRASTHGFWEDTAPAQDWAPSFASARRGSSSSVSPGSSEPLSSRGLPLMLSCPVTDFAFQKHCPEPVPKHCSLVLWRRLRSEAGLVGPRASYAKPLKPQIFSSVKWDPICALGLS